MVAISSTTGDGEQPEKARKMLQVLRRSDPADRAMRNTRLAYLGLGDTNYNQFCNGPKTMRSKMLELGAVEICPPGWADDGIGLAYNKANFIMLRCEAGRIFDPHPLIFSA